MRGMLEDESSKKRADMLKAMQMENQKLVNSHLVLSFRQKKRKKKKQSLRRHSSNKIIRRLTTVLFLMEKRLTYLLPLKNSLKPRALLSR
jgi:hypothetical protein